MPFLKINSKIQSLSTQKGKETYKTGLRHAIFNVPGDKYIGEWKNNKKDGKGSLYTQSGKLYEGDWAYNVRHGYGILTEKQSNDVYKAVYVGEWKNGKKQGIGRQFYPDGGWYEGEWENSKRHGSGQCMFADRSFYYGQWYHDRFHGYGLFCKDNGNRYEGEWKQGMKHGRGKFYHLNSGQLQEGIWHNDISVCSIMTDINFRQSASEPTKYPIQQNELQNPSGVYQARETQVIQKQAPTTSRNLPVIRPKPIYTKNN